MVKKIFTYTVIFSMLNFLGCYSFQKVSKDEVVKTPVNDIEVQLSNKLQFSFEAGNYILRNDTIYGSGKTKLPDENSRYENFEGGVAIDSSATLRMYKFDPALIVVLAAVLGTAVYFTAKSLSDFSLKSR